MMNLLLKGVAVTAVTTAMLLAGDVHIADAGGAIAGTVSFEGEAPSRRPVRMSADPSCAAANPDGRLGDAILIADGKLQNVFVYLKEGVSGTFEKPSEIVTLDQNGCVYEPRVVGAMVGQTIEILNTDSTLHNVHSLPKESKQFNNAMPIKGMKIKKRFTAPEVMVQMKCDVHPWMAAWIGVLDHPFFTVSAADGSFTIENVPAGTYTVEAWHEKFGTRTATVTVSEGGSAGSDFSFARAN
jgi:plastocyanin